MAPIKLNDNKIIQLLEVYEKCACLWDAKLESYKNKQARDEAYATMLESLRVPGLTVRELKNKIKSIRSTYIQEFRKLTQYIAKYGNEYVPRLIWFSRADAFLRQVYVPRKDILDGTPIIKEIDYDEYINVQGKPDNITSENAGNDFSDSHFDDNSTNNMQLPTDDLYTNQTNIDNSERLHKENILISDTGHKETNTITNSFQHASTSASHSMKPLLNNGPKRKVSLDDNAKRRKQASDVMPWDLMEPLKKRQKYTVNNEFDLFATFIAVQLQKMPLHLALRCQNSIQIMLTDERLRICEEKQTKNNLKDMSSMHNYSLPEIGNSSKNDSRFVTVKS